MKQEANEPNRNYISHRILSWCGEHKMKLILIVFVLGSLFGGLWYQSEQNCAGFKLNLSWDTTEGGKSIPTATEDIEVIINQNQEAKLVITVTTPREGILRVNIDSPDKTIEVYKDEGTLMETLPYMVREIYVLKGKDIEVSSLRLKALPRSTKYGLYRLCYIRQSM